MPTGKVISYASLITALALAAYGQHIIDSRETFGSGWPLIGAFHEELTRIFRTPQSVALGLTILLVSCWLFVRSLSPLLPNGVATDGNSTNRAVQPQARARWRPEALGLFGLAAIGWGWLIVQLAFGGNQASNLWLFWGSLACATLGFLAISRHRLPTSANRGRWHILEYVFAATLVGFFIGLMVHDLANWRYARIGDEAVFWEFASTIAYGDHDLNYFTFRGPTDEHPVLSSLYQGMVMRMAGVGMFSWKLSTTLAIAGSLPFFYWLIRSTLGVRPAVFSTAILTCSHVLFAYAHTGYDNALAIFPTVAALAFYAAGRAPRHPLLLYGAGVMAGLGFYTFYTARTAIMVIALAFALEAVSEWRRHRLREHVIAGLPIAVGFVMTVSPLFALDGLAVITGMGERSLFADVSFTEGLGTLIDNIPRAFLAFNYFPFNHHYVSGSLLDEISVVLAVLGLAYALSRPREPGYSLLLIWLVVVVVVSGVLHQHARTEMPSRMNLAIAPMAAFAGLALDRLVVVISALSKDNRASIVVGAVTFVVVLGAILGFNVHRFWRETPSVHDYSNTTVIYQQATSPTCAIEGHRSVIIARPSEEGGIADVFIWYREEHLAPLFLPYNGPHEEYQSLLAADELIPDAAVSCLMFTAPPDPKDQETIDEYARIVASRAGSQSLATDPSGRSPIVVLGLQSR